MLFTFARVLRRAGGLSAPRSLAATRTSTRLYEATTGAYGAGQITVLEGLEAVRSTELRETPLGLLPAHAYGVLACVEVADQRFLHMRNPWGKGEGNGDWRGPWSNASTQWDDFPEVLTEMMNDESLAWDRNANDGTFFMAFEDFCARFDTLHVCKLFVDDK